MPGMNGAKSERRGSLRLRAVQTPIIPVVAELIRNNPGTISLGQGVVYYDPPPAAFDALKDCLSDSGNHKYGAVQGLPQLQDIVVEKLTAQNRIISESSNIVISAGSNMGFYNVLLAISDPGDEIVLVHPFYFNHEMAITMAACVPVPVTAGSDYQLSPDKIASAVTDKTRAIITISPNNPSGAVYPESTLRAINELCASKGIYHISDEAYEDFVFDGSKHFSPGSIEGSLAHTISLFSLSKAYGFAGWRIGYTVMPSHLVDPVIKIQDTVLICPTLVSQQAAIGAVNEGKAYCDRKLRSIVEIRGLFMQRLRALNGLVGPVLSQGAFYILLRIHTDMHDMVLIERLIREHGVAAIPGSAFGITDGCYLRIAFAALDKETATQGIDRLVNGLVDLVGAG